MTIAPHRAMPPTLLPPPEHDPDGLHLMASLRARITTGAASPVSVRTDHYQKPLIALAQLIGIRRNHGAPTAELQRLEACQRDLQSLARGI